jgi:hypothetical protein
MEFTAELLDWSREGKHEVKFLSISIRYKI